jgi:hypothetical protein
MNIVLVEPDCRKYFHTEEQLKELLKAEPCRVIYWDYTLPVGLEPGSRCILISTMSSGTKRMHRELFCSNPEIRSWIVTILDVSSRSEQRQLTESLDGLLVGCQCPVTILFDNRELEKTAQVCTQPVNPERVCLICSGNEDLARRCGEVLASRLENWRFEINGDGFEHADVILLAGTREEDFRIPAPEYGMGRCYAWICQKVPFDNRCRKDVLETLIRNGWNRMCRERLYESNLEMEVYAADLDKGRTDFAALTYEPDFVICDAYGLPLLTSDYNADAILDFLKRTTCFAELTAKF